MSSCQIASVGVSGAPQAGQRVGSQGREGAGWDAEAAGGGGETGGKSGNSLELEELARGSETGGVSGVFGEESSSRSGKMAPARMPRPIKNKIPGHQKSKIASTPMPTTQTAARMEPLTRTLAPMTNMMPGHQY